MLSSLRKFPCAQTLRLKKSNLPISAATAARFGTTGAKRQEEYITHSRLTLPSTKNVTIMEILRANTNTWGDKIAFECPTMEVKYTHNEIFRLGRNFAAALLKSGIKRGDIVAIILPNCPQYSPILNAMLETGIIASPMSPLYSPDELKTMLVGCKAKGVVTFPPYVPLMQAIHQAAGPEILKTIVTVGDAEDGVHAFDDMVKADSSGVEWLQGAKLDTSQEDAMIMWSSGTTGPSKGVVLTQENLVTEVLQLQHKDASKYDKGKETGLGLIPFFHVFGSVSLLQMSVSLGGTVITMPSFDPELFVRILKEYKLQFMHVVPPLVGFLASNPAITKEDLSEINSIVSSGAACAPVNIRALLQKTPPGTIYYEAYGMTELAGACHMLFHDDKNVHLGSIGQPMAGASAKVVDLDSGKSLPPNTNGEICVKGSQVMKGYLNNPEATKNTIDSEGWVHTGDIGYYDSDGFFYIVDRLKELIKVKGLQVAPSELEHLLHAHEKIADIAIIGIPDERAGELPRAFIVPRDSSLTADEIHQYLAPKVAPYKQLKGGIEFVTAIPKSPSGKILRRQLKDEYLAKLQKP